MSDLKTIIHHLEESVQLKASLLTLLTEQKSPSFGLNITQGIEIIINTLANGNKLLVCGNGGSAADSQHFVAELINRFETERHPLPAIDLTTNSSNLTAIANDYNFQLVFEKQVLALGNTNDCLVAISTSGNSPSILNAISVALKKNLKVIALTGKNGGEIAKLANPNLLEIRIPHQRTARIQEMHMLLIHAWCQIIDEKFTI